MRAVAYVCLFSDTLKNLARYRNTLPNSSSTYYISVLVTQQRVP